MTERQILVLAVAKRGLFAIFLIAGMLLSAAPAYAIVGGEIDGNRHPYVGSIDASPTGRTIPGSGVLVSPTVYLTAGHATGFFDQAGLTQARVTFDPVVSSSSTYYTGTVHTNPGFYGSGGDHYDLGVVVFPSPIPGISPATLPSAGLLDQLGSQGLHDEIFTTVGYGVSRLLGGKYDGTGTPRVDRTSGGTRKLVHESFFSFDPWVLRLEMHEDGVTCTGDSGSPSLFDGTSLIAGVSVSGDAACSNMDEHIRVDTPSARAFLGQYVSLP